MASVAVLCMLILVFPSKESKSSSHWLGYTRVVEPHPFLTTVSPASSSSSSPSYFLFRTPIFITENLLPSWSARSGPVSYIGVSDIVSHSPAMASSLRNSSGTATPISASWVSCRFLSSGVACFKVLVGGGIAAVRLHGAPAAPDASDPDATPFSRCTSFFARCLSRSSRSWPRCRSRRNRLIFPWCLGVAS